MTVRRGAKKKYRRQPGSSDRELYRVKQLTISGTVFVLLVAVKLWFPKQMAIVGEPLDRLLSRNMDVTEVFAVIGNAFSDGKWEADSVYQAVFGAENDKGGIVDTVEEENTDKQGSEAAAILYTDVNLPANVNLQQVVLGFDYCAPVMGNISSCFGYRKNPLSESDRFHYGLDVTAEEGTEIVAFADGIVTVTAESSSYGNYLIVAHDNGCTTLYAHCKSIHVSAGQAVKKGEKLALAGNSGQATGPHLHFELQQNGIYLNPVYYVL